MRVAADLHIHIGKTDNGQAVKIPTSPDLTLKNILRAAYEIKGLQLVGIVDAACLGVISDLEKAADLGIIEPLNGGGFSDGRVALFLGSEVELAHPKTRGAAHFIGFFPTMSDIKAYANEARKFLTNAYLSTQKTRLSPDDWLDLVIDNHGVAIAAHAFTPHKGVYGNCVSRLEEMFSKPEKFTAIELGLSADTQMAELIPDTHSYSYISSSDAHSLQKIGREFTIYELPELSFASWVSALQGENGRILATHGMEPLLGKYHRSFCPACRRTAHEEEPVLSCPQCGGDVVLGVWDRILSIAVPSEHAPERPPYVSHIPLEMIPEVGREKRQKLYRTGTEIEILYEKPLDELAGVVGQSAALQIMRARQGKLGLIPGGGGKYGKVTKWQEKG